MNITVFSEHGEEMVEGSMQGQAWPGSWWEEQEIMTREVNVNAKREVIK